jgi:hypothetical protein
MTGTTEGESGYGALGRTRSGSLPCLKTQERLKLFAENHGEAATAASFHQGALSTLLRVRLPEFPFGVLLFCLQNVDSVSGCGTGGSAAELGFAPKVHPVCCVNAALLLVSLYNLW